MTLGRARINEIHRALPTRRAEIHPGLRLAHGLDRWPDGDNADIKKNLINDIAALQKPPFYAHALRRWKKITGDPQRFFSFELPLQNRLYIGLSRDNPVETGVTVSHSYGMPIIPGSSVKGLARASAEYVAKETGTIRSEVIHWLFGEGGDTGQGGGIFYHDAWWCGAGSPFVAEIVTPHHPDYYQGGNRPASDTDSPIPAPQLAVTGSFYFVLEGDPQWTPVAGRLLQAGLQQWGIGGKKSSGYGYFRE